MQTLGVDFSTDPSNISCCLVDWAADQPRIAVEEFGLRKRDPWDDLRGRIDSIGTQGKVGLDVPLGWPKTFVSALEKHARNGEWTCSRDACLWRTTDNRVKEAKGPKGERGRPPLSVTANLIAATAIEAARQLSLCATRVDRSGRSGQVCEVYPAVALRRWGLQDTGYKGTKPKALERRRGIISGLIGNLPWTQQYAALFEHSDNHLDAFVCALVARLVTLGRAEGPETDGDWADARVEGWIWIPIEGSLGALTNGDACYQHAGAGTIEHHERKPENRDHR